MMRDVALLYTAAALLPTIAAAQDEYGIEHVPERVPVWGFARNQPFAALFIGVTATCIVGAFVDNRLAQTIPSVDETASGILVVAPALVWS